MNPTLARHSGLAHEAFFYRHADEYTAGIGAFVQEGLRGAEPVLVALAGSHLDAVRSALGSDAERVHLVDMAGAGRNPGRIIPTVLFPFVQEHATARVRIVSEAIWPGRTAVEYRAAVQHEALINIALTGHEASILCPYDARRLDGVALADARRTHPALLDGDRCEGSPDYSDPRVVADESLRAMPRPPHCLDDSLVFESPSDLRIVRQFVRRLATRAGLPEEQVRNLCLAVNEVATNTVVHTDAAGTVSVWQDSDAECLVCEISDSGHLDDLLIGRIPPADSNPHGRGLILVNSLCDLVEMPTGQVGNGTTLRLHMQLR
jgi:anti-sigma regulatory factor (Ser/Thr protein kinase)